MLSKTHGQDKRAEMTDIDEVIKKKQAWKKKLRNQQAQALRAVRNSLRKNVDPEPFDWDGLYSTITTAIFLIIIAVVVMIVFSPKAHAWTDEEIVNAIFKSEGGKNAQYPYGIRSVRVSSIAEARKVCFNTVRNNKKRFARSKNRKNQDYIAFLASRYCPIGAGNDPKGLNKNWERNVRYYLKKERKNG